jgi:hypothetical protein
MAQRRMFSLDIVDTDLFLDMPASTQNLYFHLGMRADDDGFVSSPKRITTLVNCSNDDLKLLVAKGLVIPFDTGVCVIRDWKINNYIQKDRYRETKYLAEKSTLEITETGAYSIMDTPCIQSASILDTQDRLEIGKSKDRLGEGNNEGVRGNAAPTPSKKEAAIKKPITPLEKAIEDFKDFRKKIKAPMTEQAVKLLREKLVKLAGDNEDLMIRILEQSILYGWKGVFALKGDSDNGKGQRDTEKPADYYDAGFKGFKQA